MNWSVCVCVVTVAQFIYLDIYTAGLFGVALILYLVARRRAAMSQSYARIDQEAMATVRGLEVLALICIW